MPSSKTTNPTPNKPEIENPFSAGEPRQRASGGKRPAKKSSYGKQLAEKQAAKRLYGLRERQFANYVNEASKKTGDTSKFLIQYLESRLDNTVFRLGFGKTRAAAKQLVGHGHILVNSKKVDIPSYRVKVGDVIAFSPKSADKKIATSLKDVLVKFETPIWLSLDAAALSGKVLNNPVLDMPPFNAKVIIEFYSR